MTIYDISRQAGVSIATVSRVLNGSQKVSETTRKKILDIMERCDYTPNAFARGLGLNTMKTIGIIAADSSDLYQAKAIYYLEELLRFHDYDSLLCCSGYDPEQKKKSMTLLLNKKVDGIILVGSGFVYDRAEANQYILDAAVQIPIMLLNASLEGGNIYSILSDDSSSIQEATLLMIDSGIDDILFLYNSNSYSSEKKRTGYENAMNSRHLPLRESMYQGPHEDIRKIADHMTKIWTGKRFRGVIAADDALAIGALKFARQAGLQIPTECSIIGYNNSLLARCSEPELSSIDNKLDILCHRLISTLMGVLSGNEMPKQTIFSGELVLRGTTPF